MAIISEWKSWIRIFVKVIVVGRKNIYGILSIIEHSTLYPPFEITICKRQALLVGK
jgi:hypothetical protein